MQRLLLCLLAAGMLTGCGRGKKEAPPSAEAQEQANRAVLEQLWNGLSELRASNKVEQVVSTLQGAMTDARYQDVRPQVFEWLLAELAMQNRVEEAQTAFLEKMGTDPALTAAGFGIIESALERNGSHEAILKWCDLQLSKGLPKEYVTRTWMQMARAYEALHRLADLAARVPEVLAIQPVEQAESVLTVAVDLGVRSRDFEGVGQILDAIEKGGKQEPRFKQFVVTRRADVLLGQAKLADAEAFLWQHATEFEDPMLLERMQRLMQMLNGTGDTNGVERLVRRALADLAARPATRGELSARWVRQAADAKSTPQFLARVKAVLDGGAAGARLLGAFEEGFYAVMTSGAPQQKVACRELAQRLHGAAELSEGDRERMSSLLLDASFYLNDFKSALALVKKGIAGKDQEWHQTLINKIEAHIALGENRPEDAIRCFRKHMDTVKAWKDPQRNPENGVLMYKEAVLGYNEKRIGDIYRSMGRKDDADAAYRRARDCYRDALKVVEKDSDEYKQYQQEMAEVPGATP